VFKFTRQKISNLKKKEERREKRRETIYTMKKNIYIGMNILF
jgi:hypothetical protein